MGRKPIDIAVMNCVLLGVLCFAGAFVAVADAANVTETGLNVVLCGVGSSLCPPMSSATFIGLIVGSIIGFPAVLVLLGVLGLLGDGED